MKKLAAALLSFGLIGTTLPAPVRANGTEGRPGKLKHVLLISVDGMHALDLERYVTQNPNSNLAQLSQHGVTFTNTSTSLPSDSFPGLAALVTGGSPASAGLYYDVTYNRVLTGPKVTTPYGIPATACPGPGGTQVGFDEEIDVDYTQLNAGRDQSYLSEAIIDPDFLPRDPNTCKPVYPHNYLQVNTIFEVVKWHGGYTAWSDKHQAYEWTKGPSGKGLDDFYAPEINSIPVDLPQVTLLPCNPLPDPANATPSNAWTDSIENIKCYDALKVQAILNEIDGLSHDGKTKTQTPAVFGMNFQAVSVGQKLKTGGYTDVLGTPTANLAGELDFVDRSLGLFVNELRKTNKLNSTLIIIGAKHGQSPIDLGKRQAIPGSTPQTVVGAPYVFDISDDASLIWLDDPSHAAAVVQTLSQPQNQRAMGIQEILAGPSLALRYPNPADNDRVPDIIVKVNTGVIFTGGSKISEHGGMNEDDFHTALLVSNPSFSTKTVKTQVLNQQVAPTILRALGYDPEELDAVRIEGVSVLPHIFEQDW